MENISFQRTAGAGCVLRGRLSGIFIPGLEGRINTVVGWISVQLKPASKSPLRWVWSNLMVLAGPLRNMGLSPSGPTTTRRTSGCISTMMFIPGYDLGEKNWVKNAGNTFPQVFFLLIYAHNSVFITI